MTDIAVVNDEGCCCSVALLGSAALWLGNELDFSELYWIGPGSINPELPWTYAVDC